MNAPVLVAERHTDDARPGGLPAVLRRHWVMAVLVTLALVLRVAAMTAYRPALGLFGDSVSYLQDAQRLRPGPFHPLGYPLELRLFTWTGSLVSVVLVQHALGVCLGVATYAALLRLGVRRGLAAIAAAPILVDAYQANVEQFVMPEAIFEALLLGAVGLLLLRGSRWKSAAGAGVLVAVAAVTRGVGLPLIVLAALWLLVSRAGWRPVAAFLVAATLPVLGYMTWYDARNGNFAMTGYGPRFLWAKVAPIANCESDGMPTRLRWLCPSAPIGHRHTTNFYEWDGTSPFFTHRETDAQKYADAQSFAERVIVHQPLDYARLVGRDMLHYFRPTRTSNRSDYHVQTWWFLDPLRPQTWHAGLLPASPAAARNERALPPIQSAHAPAGLLRQYQRFGFVPGPVIALCALLGLAGFFWTGSGDDGRRRRWISPFLTLMGLALLLVPAATVPLDYRYLLPSMILIVPAGVLGLDGLIRRRQERAG